MARALWCLLVIGVVASAGVWSEPAPGTRLADEYELTIAIPDHARNWSDLFILDPAGGPRQPTPGLFRGVTYHRWTADGKRVVYRAREALWVENVDGTSTKKIVSDYYAESPVWLADQKTIAFSCKFGRAQVCVVPANGGRPRLIADLTIEKSNHMLESSIESIDVSRDDTLLLTRVVYIDPGDDKPLEWRYDIVTVRADGTDIRPLTKLVSEWRGSAAFSPDGKTIAFSDGLRLRMMNADGSGKRTIKYFDRAHGVPWGIAWSPAGDLLAYGSNQSLWVIKPDGSDPRRLARQPDTLGMAWRRR